MDILLILPNQLITDISVIPSSIRHIYIIEEPHYFSTKDIRPNKIKISYLRACMRFYYMNILKKSKISASYIDINYIKNKGYDFIKDDGNVYIYEINDFKSMMDGTKTEAVVVRAPAQGLFLKKVYYD